MLWRLADVAVLVVLVVVGYQAIDKGYRAGRGAPKNQGRPSWTMGSLARRTNHGFEQSSTLTWQIEKSEARKSSGGPIVILHAKLDLALIQDLMNDYAGQYIMIDAIPGTTQNALELPEEEGLETLLQELSFFERQAAELIGLWRNEFERIRDEHRRVVLWGSGSKAVSFLSTIGILEAIQYVVDINPYRQGTYLAGNGQLVVPPEFLVEYRPCEVLVMNEVYVQEVRRDLMRFDLKPELRPVCDRFPAGATAAGSAHC